MMTMNDVPVGGAVAQGDLKGSFESFPDQVPGLLGASRKQLVANLPAVADAGQARNLADPIIYSRHPWDGDEFTRVLSQRVGDEIECSDVPAADMLHERCNKRPYYRLPVAFRRNDQISVAPEVREGIQGSTIRSVHLERRQRAKSL
jgi:hypothetical protein